MKPVLKYILKSNGKLEETIKNDAKLMNEELQDTIGYALYSKKKTFLEYRIKSYLIKDPKLTNVPG